MNAYEIDTSKLKDSKVITDEKEILKLSLANVFLKAISKMSTDEVLELTGLHKSDLSRIKVLSLNRFTIDRLINLLDKSGYSIKFNIKPKKAS